MVACIYEISLLEFNSTSHSFAALTRKLLSWTLEENFHIYARPCIILYIIYLLQACILMWRQSLLFYQREGKEHVEEKIIHSIMRINS